MPFKNGLENRTLNHLVLSQVPFSTGIRYAIACAKKEQNR